MGIDLDLLSHIVKEKVEIPLKDLMQLYIYITIIHYMYTLIKPCHSWKISILMFG